METYIEDSETIYAHKADSGCRWVFTLKIEGIIGPVPMIGRGSTSKEAAKSLGDLRAPYEILTVKPIA